MTKTEAAEILATYINAKARERGARTVTALFIAECIGEARYSAEGSRHHTAGWLRPADRTIRRFLDLSDLNR